MTKPEPEPCPFCGGETVIEQVCGKGETYVILCSRCQVHSLERFGDPSEPDPRPVLIRRWNKRTLPEDVRKTLKVLLVLICDHNNGDDCPECGVPCMGLDNENHRTNCVLGDALEHAEELTRAD